MLKINVSQLNLSNLKRKREDCAVHHCGQAPAGQGSTDKSSMDVAQDSMLNTSYGNTENQKLSVHRSSGGETSTKNSSNENDCFEPPRKRVKNSHPAPGRRNVLLYIKQKLLRKAVITHATAARKRWQLEPKRKNMTSHKLMTGTSCLPNRTKLDVTRMDEIKSSESENTSKNSIHTITNDTEYSGVESNAKNAHEVSAPCNETDLENASIHSISSEDVAIDWQPDSQANNNAFVDYMSLDSNESDTTASGRRMMQVHSTIESVESEDHHGGDICRKVKDHESLAIANIEGQTETTEQTVTRIKNVKCTNGHIDTGHNIASNKNTTCDKKSPIVSVNVKADMESDSSQSKETTLVETNNSKDSTDHERNRNDEKTQDVCHHSKSDSNVGPNGTATGYENSNMDYQAVLSDLDFIYELENSQKIPADTSTGLVSQCDNPQVKSSMMDNLVQSNTCKETLPRAGNVSGLQNEHAGNEVTTTSTISNSLDSSHSTLDRKTNENEKVSEMMASEQKEMLEVKKPNAHATQESMDLNSNDTPCSAETSTCNKERNLPTGKPNSESNQEIIDADMEPQTTVSDEGGDDVLLQEAVTDDADYISVADSVDDDLLVDERVSFILLLTSSRWKKFPQ